ncbi:MAG: hypothetical protein E7315_00250 [Clostridiales bacterium]|nr:hypothetical protein [Clostridiales bacterium]
MEYSDFDERLDAHCEALADENEARFSPEALIEDFIKSKIEGMPNVSSINDIPIGTVIEDEPCKPRGAYILARTAPDLFLRAGDILFAHACQRQRSFGLYIVREGGNLLVRELARDTVEADVVTFVTEVRRLYE